MNTSSLPNRPLVTIQRPIGTRFLLGCGVAVAPIFLIVALVQMLTRPGFDISRHAVSSLQNGNFGWVQSVNFIAAGILSLLFAWGVRRALRGGRGHTWAPVLFGMFGAGMVVAGFFPPDPAFGFPEGTPDGPPEAMSAIGGLHTAGFFVAFMALIAACFVVARRFGERVSIWRRYSLIVGVTTPVLIALGNVFLGAGGVFYLAAGAVSFVWMSSVAARLIGERSGEHEVARL